MLNNLYQFLSPRQWGISLAGLGLLLGLGFIGKQTQVVPVTDSPLSSARIHNTSDNSLLSQLRRVREQRGQLNAATGEKGIFMHKSGKTLPTTTALVPDSQGATKSAEGLPKVNFPVKDGVYLYGQSSKPNQLGQGYIIFQKQQDKVIGALYMPHSEFNCFQGTLNKSGELAMTVNSSSNEASTPGSNQVAANGKLPQVSEDEFSSYPYSLALQDFYQLNSITASDRRTLQMCK
ncbi:hypothetical protein GTQ43_11790 [Nostoc sp. KVJ3]|uniref:hypothetical protein n=1 Tax=Nostoc sp. KVJ3 TaxID=457945 RepID=UPI002237C4EE|nr:hypothetical protein [Nostoc sp. KVJ3]MCW5314464.1 hypothetical protein [Nostoc sp. KVJ3]